MAASNSTGTQAAGGKWHVVKQGDCISSIAVRYGHFWQTIWDHGQNQAICELREDPDQLMPGDRVWVPEPRICEEIGATDQRHRFRCRGVPAKLRLRFLLRGEPRDGAAYRIVIDGGEIVRGNLDADGMLEMPIPPEAQCAQVFIGEGADESRYEFRLGHIDPLSEVSGIQWRLHNLTLLRADELFHGTSGLSLVALGHTHTACLIEGRRGTSFFWMHPHARRYLGSGYCLPSAATLARSLPGAPAS